MEMVNFIVKHCFCSFYFSLVILIQMEEGAKDVIIYLKMSSADLDMFPFFTLFLLQIFCLHAENSGI